MVKNKYYGKKFLEKLDYYTVQVFIKNKLLNFQMYLISIQFMNEFF